MSVDICGGAGVLKVAVTLVSAVTVTSQADVPLHAPPHPVNVELPVGFGVSVTLVPLSKSALQVLPQLIPPGLLLTVPVPLPAI